MTRVAHVGVAVLVGALFALVNGPAILDAAFDGDEVQQIEFLAGAASRSAMSHSSLWTFFEGTEAERETIARRVFDGEEAWCTPIDTPRPKMKFLRPLPSLSLALDHSLFGIAPFGYHLHSLLWYLAVLAALTGLLRVAFPEGAGWLAAVALFAFAFDATHAEVVGRIATRHLLIGTFLGLIALGAWVRARERRSWRTGVVALTSLLLALLSSENAVQFFPYFVTCELWRAREAWPAKLRALLPVGLVAVAYVVAHRVAGFGARGVDYLDPFGTPVPELLSELPLRFADLINERLLGLPGVVGWGATPWRLTGLDWPPAGRIALGICLLAACAHVTVRATRSLSADHRAAVRWLAAGGVLALGPALFGQPGPRLLFVPGIGAAVAFASMARAALGAVRASGAGLTGRVGWSVVGVAVIVSHFLLAPVGLRFQLRSLALVTRALHERWLPPAGAGTGANVTEVAPSRGVTDVVVLAAPSTSLPRRLFPQFEQVVVHGGVFSRTDEQRWWYLSNNMLDFEHEMNRTGPSSFELRLGRPRSNAPIAHDLWLGCESFPGAVVETRSLRITVLETGHGGAITRIGVELARDVDIEQVLFVMWHDGALRPTRLPAAAP